CAVVLSLLPPLPPPRSTLFPYTTLFRSGGAEIGGGETELVAAPVAVVDHVGDGVEAAEHLRRGGDVSAEQSLPDRRGGDASGALDRKSTRLNSSHVSISYAVFCLKKKKY